MEKFLAEARVPKQVIGPVTLNGGVTGARVDMRNAKRVTFIVSVGTSTSATALALTLTQYNAASSGTSKACAISNPYYHEVNTATSFTRVDPGAATSTFDLFSLIGDSKAVVIFEVLAEDLDVNNDFGWIGLDAGTTGVTKIGSVVALVDTALKPSYSQVV